MNEKNIKRASDLIQLRTKLEKDLDLSVSLDITDYSRGSAFCNHRKNLIRAKTDMLHVVSIMAQINVENTINDINKELVEIGAHPTQDNL